MQAELQGWRSALGSAGWEMDQDTFEDLLYGAASRMMGVRDAVIAPMKPYFIYCGTWQSWRMFVAPHTSPARLAVEVERGGAWETVFQERSDEHTWRRYLFEQDRMRSVIFRYSWPNFRTSWQELARWIGRAAAEDFPDAERVRVRFYKAASASPQQVMAGEAPEGRWVQTWEEDAASLRVEAP